MDIVCVLSGKVYKKLNIKLFKSVEIYGNACKWMWKQGKCWRNIEVTKILSMHSVLLSDNTNQWFSMKISRLFSEKSLIFCENPRKFWITFEICRKISEILMAAKLSITYPRFSS